VPFEVHWGGKRNEERKEGKQAEERSCSHASRDIKKKPDRSRRGVSRGERPEKKGLHVRGLGDERAGQKNKRKPTEAIGPRGGQFERRERECVKRGGESDRWQEP